jgi:ribosomal protein L7/L12
MMSLVAVEIALSGEERDRLEVIVRSPTSEQRMVTRARVVLGAAEGKPNRQIAGDVGLSQRKVGVWRTTSSTSSRGRGGSLTSRGRRGVRYRNEVIDLARAGKKIEATRQYVRMTGVSLPQAKAAIDALGG